MVILLRHRIHRGEHRDSRRVVLPCTVVVPVQAVHAVQFLPVVLAGLQLRVQPGIAVYASERVVVRHLFQSAVPAHHHPDVALVVTGVVVHPQPAALLRRGVAAGEQEPVQRPVHIDRAAGAVRSDRPHHEHVRDVNPALPGVFFVVTVERMLHLPFPAQGVVHIKDVFLVREMDFFQVAQVIVLDVVDAPVQVHHQRPATVVGVFFRFRRAVHEVERKGANEKHFLAAEEQQETEKGSNMGTVVVSWIIYTTIRKCT